MLLPRYLLLILGCLFFPVAGWAASWPATEATEIGGGLGAGYEPSGAVWHERLGHLLLVGDDGDLTELASDGTIINSFSASADYEAITVADPASNYVYVGIENPDTIIEVDISTDPWSLTGRAWDLTPWLTGEDNAGLEALTYVATDSGNYFYAGLQQDGKIYIFDVNLEQSDAVSFIGTLTLDESLTDISDLNYQSETQTLYAIFDSADKLIEAQADGTVLQEYDLPGNDQEGIALVPACPEATTNIYIAEDVGPEVWRYSNYPINQANCAVDEIDEDSYTASVRGLYLRVFLNGERIARRKIFQRQQDKVRTRIADFYSDGQPEIVVASLFNKKGQVKLFRLTVAQRLKAKASRAINFQKRKNSLALALNLAQQKLRVTFGQAVYRWKITSRLDLSRLKS